MALGPIHGFSRKRAVGRTQFGDGFGLAFNPEKNALGFVQVHRPTLVQI